MLLKKIFLTVVSVVVRLFLPHSEPSEVEPLSGEAREIAHRAFYSDHEMRVHPDHAGIKDTKFRWYKYPGAAEIPFVINDNLNDQKDLITEAMQQYHDHTCVRFVPREKQQNYISIEKGIGCWSYVGMISRGLQVVSIGDGCARLGTIVHELGHAVGLFHEHQRSDRDTYIRVFEKNIKEGFIGQFNKTKLKDQAIYTRYDTGSCMHYGNYAFSKKFGELKTMESKDGKPLLEPYDKKGLTKLDIDQINALYKCKN